LSLITIVFVLETVSFRPGDGLFFDRPDNKLFGRFPNIPVTCRVLTHLGTIFAAKGSKMKNGMLDLLDEMTAIAQLGINYSKDPYDLGRYNRLLELAAGEYADFTSFPADSIRQRFTRELGYITPKIGVQGALFNAEGKILLEQRVDDALWGLPAG